MAKDRQSSAEAQATAPALLGSPMLTMGLGGSYSFQRLGDEPTNWGQAIYVRHTVLEGLKGRRTGTEVCRVDPLVGFFGIHRWHPAKLTNGGLENC